jgi:hypothetical protein
VTNINEGQREAEGLHRILELQSLIDGIDVCNFIVVFLTFEIVN